MAEVKQYPVRLDDSRVMEWPSIIIPKYCEVLVRGFD